MERALALHRAEHVVDRFVYPAGVFGMTRQVGFVDLDDGGVDSGDLLTEGFRDRHGEVG